MNTTALRYVVEVNRVRSITKAAQNLYMGQPNLSRAIKDLESELGITIFKRTAKGVTPTPRGEEFLAYAQSITAQLDELESLYRPRSTEALELNVAVPRASYVTAAFADFLNGRAGREHISVHFRETDAISTLNLVSSGEMDFGMIRYQLRHEGYFQQLIAENGLEAETLREFNLAVIFAEDHPLASLEEIPYHKLAGYPEIVHGDYQAPSLSFHQIRKGAELEASMKRIYIYDRGSQYDLLQRVKGAYMWVSPVPEEILRQRGMVLRPCRLSGIPNRDVLVRPAGKTLSDDCLQFIETLRRNAKAN